MFDNKVVCPFCKNEFDINDVYRYEYKDKDYSNVCKYCIARIDENIIGEYLELNR